MTYVIWSLKRLIIRLLVGSAVTGNDERSSPLKLAGITSSGVQLTRWTPSLPHSHPFHHSCNDSAFILSSLHSPVLLTCRDYTLPPLLFLLSCRRTLGYCLKWCEQCLNGLDSPSDPSPVTHGAPHPLLPDCIHYLSLPPLTPLI